MRMTEISFDEQPPIDSYGPGGFRVAEIWREGSLILGPAGLSHFTPPLSAETVAPALAMAPDIDVVLIGQGADIAALPKKLRAMFEEAGIGVEIMSTASACRTYNVMLAEDRRVAAVLIAV